MFNILRYKENTYQNDTEISSHPSENSNHQENKQQTMLVRMQEKRNPQTLLMGM
jgi:hypothetical protein